MFKFKCIAGPGSDCTALYEVELDKEYTVLEFISTVLKEKPGEWGRIGFADSLIDWGPYLEYRRGEVISGEEELADCLDSKIVSVRSHGGWSNMDYMLKIEDRIEHDESAEATQGWIPCSERLPKELEAVNVTWVNHNPPAYYQHIKDVPKADTAVYYRGAWYWWDAEVIDLLGEYGGVYIHGIEPIDKDIEITAWMPLPKPYKGGGDE